MSSASSTPASPRNGWPPTTSTGPSPRAWPPERRAPKSDEQRRGEAAQLEARSHHDVVDRLERITCPTLVACGRYDGIAPEANGRAIAERVPDAELPACSRAATPSSARTPRPCPEVLDFLDQP